MIDYNATVAYADEDKKNVAIYGGLPIFRATGTGEAEVVITFKSHENHNVYAGFSKSQFKNDATYSIDSDLNLRNENDVKYTSNLFNRDKEYTFKGVVYHPTLVGYLRLSEPIYYNGQELISTEQENKSEIINTSNNSKATSNTIENPKTGVKNYMTVGISAILILGITYKLYKKKVSI